MINGKKYGPYLYENKRIDGKVVTVYLGPANKENKNSISIKNKFSRNFLILGIILILAFIGLFLFYNSFSPTGNAVLNIETNYLEGENLEGQINLVLKQGELIPSDSNFILELGTNSKNYKLSEIVDLQKVEGNFYAEGKSLSGLGEGYGIVGQKKIYPNVDFELKIISSSSDSSDSTNDNPSDVSTDTPSDPVTDNPDSTTDNPSDVSTDTPSDPSNDAAEDSTGLITGNVVIDEPEEVISGSVSRGEDFEYTASFESFEILSVSINGEEVDKSIISVFEEEGSIIVSTDYEIIESGFGSEFLGEEELELSIELSDLNITAEEGVLEVSLSYFSEEIVSASQEINVEKDNDDGESGGTNSNYTNQSYTQNESIIETNVTEISNITEITNVSDVVNQTSIVQIKEFDNMRISANSSILIDLNEYFAGYESAEYIGAGINAVFLGNMVNLSAKEGTRGALKASFLLVNGSESLIGNEFSILVSSGALNIITSREKIVLGESVKWTKNVTLENGEDIVVDLPGSAENVSVLKIDDNGEEEIEVSSIITGNVVKSTNKGNFIINFFNKVLSALTGRVITDSLENESLQVKLDQNATSYIIEYITPAPEAREEEREKGKNVIISAPDELGYTNVIASTNITEIYGYDRLDSIKIYWRNYDDSNVTIKEVSEVEEEEIVEEILVDSNLSEESIDTSSLSTGLLTGNVVAQTQNSSNYILEDIPFDAYDLDFDGMIDYIEWVVPHLSEQTFEIIFITKAEELDADRVFLRDIYEYVREKDNDFVTIDSGNYVRVSFEKNLTSSKDITLYARSSGAQVEVYEKDGDEVLITFDISEYGEYKQYLTKLSGLQDTFDLKVLGNSVEFDYIVDPTIIFVNDSIPRFSGTPANNVNITSSSFIPVANSLLVTCVSSDSGDNQDISIEVSSSSSLTWTKRVEMDYGYSGGNSGYAGIFTAPVTTSESMNVSVLRSSGDGGANRISAKVYIVSGVDITNPAGNSSKGGTSTNNINGSYVSISNNSIGFGCANDWQASGVPSSLDVNDSAHYTGVISVMSIYKQNVTENSGTNVELNFDAFGTSDVEWNWVVLEIISDSPKLSFVSPTPSNGASRNSSSVYVNMSSSGPSDHYSFVDFDNSLFAWYKLEKGNGTFFADRTGKHNGTCTGTSCPTFNSDGWWNGSYYFNRTAYITLTPEADFRFANKSFTISLWAKANTIVSDNGYMALIGKEIDFVLYGVQAGGYLQFWTWNGGWQAFSSSANSFSAGVWQHIVIMNNGTYGWIYINGVLNNSASQIHSVSNSNSMTISGKSGAYPYNGTIDEILIFNRTLSANEIKSLYNSSANKYSNNFTDLSDGTHQYKGYSVNDEGEEKSTETRTVTLNSSFSDSSGCLNITSPGTYNLLNDINNHAGVCFNISASNVVFDGGGYTIDGDFSSDGKAFYVSNVQNITIKNIKNITGFEYPTVIYNVKNISIIGVNYTYNTYGLNIKLTNNSLFSNIIVHNSSLGTGFYMENSSHNTFSNIGSNYNRWQGLEFYLSNNNTLNNIETDYNLYVGLLLSASSDNTINGATSDNNVYGYTIQSWSYDNVLINVSSTSSIGSYAGISLFRAFESSIYNSSFYSNQHGLILSESEDLNFTRVNSYNNQYTDLYQEWGNVTNMYFTDSIIQKFHLVDYSIYFFRNSTYGEIRYLSKINNSGSNLIGNQTSAIVFGNNSVFVNSSVASRGLNKSANVTLYGLPSNFINPKVIKDDDVCTNCFNFTSLNAGTVKFNVSSWSTYSIQDFPDISITDCTSLTVPRARYVLQNNINNHVGTCFTASVDNVTLDGNGYTIDGDDSGTDYGVNINGRRNITVKNLTINDFENGVYMISSNYSLILDLQINSSTGGIYIGGNSVGNNLSSLHIHDNLEGINLDTGVNNTLFNINSSYNTWAGIYLLSGSGNKIELSNFNNNYDGIYLEEHSGNHFISINAKSNSNSGIFLTGALNNNFTNITVLSNNYGINLDASLGNNFTSIIVNSSSSADMLQTSTGADNTLISDSNIQTYNIGTASKFIFRNSTWGEIKYLVGISGVGNDLIGRESSSIRFSNNSVYVEPSVAGGLNKSANITLYGIGERGYRRPYILKDGITCISPHCRNLSSLSATNVVFNVTGFSNYSVGEYVDLIWPSISFVNPTPLNASKNDSSSIFVNISSSDEDLGHYVLNDFDRSLVGWWRMEQGNGTLFFDDAGRNNLSCYGSSCPTFNSSGIWNGSYMFDGVGDNITILYNSLYAPTYEISYGGWVKIYDGGGGQLFGKCDGGGYCLIVAPTQLDSSIHNLTGYRSIQKGISSIAGSWAHVFVTYNRTHNTIYLNGEFSANQNMTGNIYYASNSPLCIGAELTANYCDAVSSKTFNGTVDDLLMFNRSLSAQEIKALYNANTNQYYNNFTGLSYGNYTFKGYAVDRGGNKNSTEIRTTSLATRFNLTECGTLDFANGNYTLMNSISNYDSGTCFTIAADNITLNGNYYTVDGDDSGTDYGIIFTGYKGINIHNIMVTDFSTGIYVLNGINNKFYNISSSSNTVYGFVSDTSGNNYVLENISSYSNTFSGILLYYLYNSTVNNIRSYSNTRDGFALNYYSRNNTFSNINISNNGWEGLALANIENNNFTNIISGSNGFRGIAFLSNVSNNYFNNVNLSSNNGALSFSGTASSNDNTFNKLIVTGTNPWGVLSQIFVPVDRNAFIDSYISSYSIVNFSKFIFRNSSFGEIRFLEGINGTGTNLFNNSNSDLIIANNSVIINGSAGQTGLNKSANITFYNFGERGYVKPGILKNGYICTDCYNFTALTANTVVFNISSGGNYSVGEDPRLSSCTALSVSGATYTLINNIYNQGGNCFNVTANNIVIDGNGYSIDGDDSGTDYGIFANGTTNITIKNFRNITDFFYGVYIANSSNNLIYNNSFISNQYQGFLLERVNSSNISKINSSFNDRFGYMERSNHNVFDDLFGTNNPTVGFQINTESSNNTINNFTSRNGASGLFLSTGCNLNKISNILLINHSYAGLHFYNGASHNSLQNITIANGTGKGLYYTNNPQNDYNNFTNLLSYGNGIDLFSEAYGFRDNYFLDSVIGSYNITDAEGYLPNRVRFRNSSFGEIKFLEGINGTGTNLIGNLTSNIIFGNNSIYVNSAFFGLNKNANLSIYGLPTNLLSPKVYKDGRVCNNCVNFTSLNAGNVVFNVTSWSNYSVFGDTTPQISFVDPTYPNASIQNTTYIFVNVSSFDSDTDHYTYLDYDNALMAHWKFEKGNDTFFVDDTGKKNLTCSACPVYNATGYWNGSYEFNGIDDYMFVPGVEVGNKNSVSFWINSRTSCSGFCSLITNAVSENGFYIWNNQLYLYWDGGDYYAPVFFGLNRWYHVVITDSGSTSTIYIDGVENSTFSKSTGYNFTAMSAYPFTGQYDEFLIFNRTLSVSEVKALYNATANQYSNNFSEHNFGNHTYKAYAIDKLANKNSTELRIVETRDPYKIYSCANLTVNGATYSLQNNINDYVGTCFNVTADNIVFDGKGYTVDGDSADDTDYGIYMSGRNNITIKNFRNISNFGATNPLVGSGVHAESSNNITLVNSSFYNNSNRGIEILSSNKINITNVVLYDNIEEGISMSQSENSSLNYVSSSGNNVGNTLTIVSNISISNSLFNELSNQYGLSLNEMYDGNIINVSAYSDNYGLYGSLVGRNNIINSTFRGNTQASVSLSDSTFNTFRNVNISNGATYALEIAGSSSHNISFIDSFVESYTLNVGSLSFKNSTWGEIYFLPLVTGSGTNLIGKSNSDVLFGNNSVYVNSSQTGLNKSANITLYGISTSYTNPTINRDGIECASGNCVNFTSLNAGTVRFNVSSWSNYSIGEDYNLNVCGTLSVAGQTYTLGANVFNRAGTCFTVSADNITLNGNGYSIDGDDSGTDYGILVSARRNITIRNFVNISDFYHGIYFINAHNNTVFNSSVISSTNAGIYMSGSHNNILLNTSSYLNVYGLQLINANYNNFTRFFANSSTTQDLYQTSTAANYNYFIDSIFKRYSIATASLLYFVNSTWGEIKFLSGISGTGNDLISNRTSDIRFENNSVYVNSLVSGLSRGANVTLYGIGNRGYSVPAILKEGYMCIDCSNFTSLNANNVIFNVTSWSNYSIGETSAVYAISSCQTLSINGAKYVLQNNISNNVGTCFTVSADNIIIDGNGYYIDGIDLGYGVIASGRKNITIVNLIIDDFQYGVYLSNSNYSLIKDSKFNLTYGSLGASGTAWSSTFYDEGGYYADCYYHEIYVYPYKSYSYGKVYGSPAYADYSDDCDQSYHDIYWEWDSVSGADGYEVYKADSGNGLIFDYYITTTSNYIYDLGVGYWSYNGGFTGDISYHKSNQFGIYLTSARNNSIQNVDSSYNSDAGIYLTSAHNNSLNGIMTRNNTNYGIYLTSSHNNSMNNLTINVNPSYGLYLTASHDNIFSNSTSYLNVYGLYLTNSQYNNFTRFFANSSITRDLYQTSTAANYNYFIDSIFKKYSIANISLLYFVNSTWGEIKFLSGINGTGNDLISNRTSDIRFFNNSVYVNSGVSGLNKSANITLYQIGERGYTSIKLLRDGAVCYVPNCYNFTALNTTEVIFNVTGWSNYSVGSGNGVPNVPTLLYPANRNVNYTRNLTFGWSGSDPDGDTLSYELNITCYKDDGSICSFPKGSDNRYYNTGVIGTATSYSLPLDLIYFMDDASYYNWSVRAYDGTNYSVWSGQWQLNMSTIVEISMPIDNVDFGQISYLNDYNTSNNDPSPFVIQNDGNVKVNITVNATNLWESVQNPNQYYQFKIDNNSVSTPNENMTFNWLSSITTYTNMSNITTLLLAIVELNYKDNNDSAEVDIKIRSPPSEGYGRRNSTITFMATLGE